MKAQGQNVPLIPPWIDQSVHAHDPGVQEFAILATIVWKYMWLHVEHV